MSDLKIVKTYENNVNNFEDLGIELDSNIKNRKELYNEKYYRTTYYKWLKDDYTHKNYKYTPNSINIDTIQFNPTGNCSAGGLYFTDAKYFLKWRAFGTHLHEVKIIPNTPVYAEFGLKAKAKAPALYLGREISQDSIEYADLLCNAPINHVLPYMNEILNFSANKNYNILDKNISIVDAVYSCIRNGSQVEKIYKDTLRNIKDVYIPEIKKKYILQIPNKIQNTEKFEDFLTQNVDEKLTDRLKETGSVISGSSVLKYMFNEVYMINDIDIYCNISNVDRLLECFYSKKQYPYMYCPHCFKKYICTQTVKCKLCNGLLKLYYTYKENNLVIRQVKSNHYNMADIAGIFNIEKKLIKIQLIVIKDDIKPDYFIKNNFDFDFCKCIYDGSRFIALESKDISLKVGKISDEYMNKCFKEKDAFSTYRISKTAERIVKYIKRGYDITNTDSFFENVLKYSQ